MQWRILTWIFIFISGLLIDLSSGRGVLTIWLLNYKNVKGRTYDGSCCDYAPTGSDTCPDQCDYVMRCIVTGLGRANDHVFLFHRPIKYDSNDISFEDESSQMTQLTILFDEWPTTSSVKMDVFFYDYDDFDHTTVLVDWFETPLQRSVEKGEKQVEVVRGNRQMDKTRLEFKWSVHCFGTNDCLKPPPEWNIWPWAAESRTYSKPNTESSVQSGSSYSLHNVSKSMTTVYPNTQRKTTVKFFNKNVDKQWVEADDTFTGNTIRSPFSPFSQHTDHGDILNGREKLFDAREHARIIDAEERFDVAPARQANHTGLKKIPIKDYHNPLNAHKKTHKGLSDNLIEPVPTIDDPFATDVPVVRDELLKEIYEKVAVELLSNDVKKGVEIVPVRPSVRLQTIIAETETKTGALPMPKNPYIDRYGEHIKLPSLGHSHKKETDDNAEDLRRHTSYPQTNVVNTDKTHTTFERTSNSPQINTESITDSSKDNESLNTNTELPKKIPMVHKHRTKPRTKPPTVRKWDKNYNWKEHYKDYVLPKQHLSKVKTHTIVWSHGKPKHSKKKGEPVSRTGAKKYPQNSLNRLKEAREKSSIEMGYYRQLHSDFITKQNQKRRKEKAKMKSSKPKTTTKVSDSNDLTTEKTKTIPINVAPINPFAKTRKPYQATLRLDSGFTDWSKDLRTKIPPVNPSAKGPMTAPRKVKNIIIKPKDTNNRVPGQSKNDNIEPEDTINHVPGHIENDNLKSHHTKVAVPDQVKNNFIKSKNTNDAVPGHQFKDKSKVKTIGADVPDYADKYINSKSISWFVPETDIIMPKTISVDTPDPAKNDIIMSKTTKVGVPHHVTDDIKFKTASVGVSDHVTNDIFNDKNDIIKSDYVKDHIKPKFTSVVPDYVKKDTTKFKSIEEPVPNHIKKDMISPIRVPVPKQAEKDTINPKSSSVPKTDQVINTGSKTSSNPFESKVIKTETVLDLVGSDISPTKNIEGITITHYPINGDVKSKPTESAKIELVKSDLNSKTKKGSVSIYYPITTKTTNGVPQNKKVKYSDDVRPLSPPLKTRDKKKIAKNKIAKKKKVSNSLNSVSSDIHIKEVFQVFYENNRSSFSVGPFLPEIDIDDKIKTKDSRSTTIHSWYVIDDKLLPDSKQPSKGPNKKANQEILKKTTYHREAIDTKLRKKSEDIIQVKVAVDPTKYIQPSSIKEALEKLNPKKSPFHPKIKPTNSHSKPHQTTQVKTIDKGIKKTEVFISESTNVPQKSTLKASKLTTLDFIRQTTIASSTKASGRDHLVVNLPLPPNIKNDVDSGPQIQGTPTAIRPKYSRNPIVNAILTPKTTQIVHVDSGLKSKTAVPNGLYIDPGGKMTTNEIVVTQRPLTQSTKTSVTNRFTPKDRGSLFETFKSLSEIIKKASRKDILKANDTSVIASKVINNVKKSPFSPNPVDRKPIISTSSSMSPTTIQWIKHSPELKKNSKVTPSKFQTTVKPMATAYHTPVGPTSPSQSPVIVFPIGDVSKTTTVSQMNIFEFLPNAIKEIYFGKAKQPFLGIQNNVLTTASFLETVRSKPTNERPFVSNPDSSETGINLNEDHDHRQTYHSFAPDPEDKGPRATTKRPSSSGLDILDNNPDDQLKYERNQKPHDLNVPVAPKSDREGELLNYVYHESKTELKGTNFLFNKKRFDPKIPRNTLKPQRPLKPTTRHRRPQIPILPSHRYFAYTRLGSADAFTTTPASTKRKNMFKLPALPTHRYFAYTRKDTPTTTKQPNTNHVRSFIEHGKVKLVSKQGIEKSHLDFQNKVSKHTTKTRFPNSAASKTFNPYHHFKSNTPSPRFPTKNGNTKSDSSKDRPTITTKQPEAVQNQKDMFISHMHPDEPDYPRSSKTPQSTPLTEQMDKQQSTKTTKTDITEKTNGVRDQKYSTKSFNKIEKTSTIYHRKQTLATKATKDTKRTNSSDQRKSTPVTIRSIFLQTEDSLNRKSYVAVDDLQINTHAFNPRPTASGNEGDSSHRKVTITSDIFRWIYDLSKSLPEINKPVSKTTNNTANIGAPEIKTNGTTVIVKDFKEQNLFNPFNIFFNLTQTIIPKTNLTLDRTKHVFANDGKHPVVEEATPSTGSPIEYLSTSHELPPRTKEIWYKDVAVLTNKENADIRRKIDHQTVTTKTTKSLEKARGKTILTDNPKSTLQSTVTTKETSTKQLEPKTVQTTTLTPSKSIPKVKVTPQSKGTVKATSQSERTSSKTMKSVPLKTSNTPKRTTPMTSHTAATTTTKTMPTHTDQPSTTTTSAVKATKTTQIPTTPKKIELTIPPWLKITTVVLPNENKVTTIISTQPQKTTEKLSKITTMQPEKPTTKKPKHTTAKKPKKLKTDTHQKPTTKKSTTKKAKHTTAKKSTTKKPTTKKPTTKKPTTKKTKKPTTKKPKKPTTKKPKMKAANKVKVSTSQKITTASTTEETRQSTTNRVPKTRKPVNITINKDPNSNDGPRIIIPKGGLFIPQPRDYNSTGYGYPGGLARLQVRKMNFKTVFNRYWPAILGLTVGTVFLVAAVLTSVACRQQRLYIRRSGWTDMPHHVSEPPDTSEYSSAASLVSDATRSSISFP